MKYKRCKVELSYNGSAGALLKECDNGWSKQITSLIREMIAVDVQPLLMVEDVGFNTPMAYLEPDYKMPCRRTVMALMESSRTPYVALTTDCWTFMNTLSYITETSHHIDYKWDMKYVLTTENLKWH